MTSSQVATSSKAINSASKGNAFVVVVTGQVETGYFPSTPSLYVRASFSSIPSTGWTKLTGEDTISACCVVPNSGRFVVDLPISATFKGISPFRWPQIVLSCFGLDSFGHDVCRGYGACTIPTTSGRHIRQVACFAPQPSSTIQALVGWVTGRRPEFIDPAIVTSDEGREATKISTTGLLTISLNIIIRGTKQLGFDLIPATLTRASDFPLPDFQIAPITQAPTEDSALSTNTSWQPPQKTSPPPLIKPSMLASVENEDTSDAKQDGDHNSEDKNPTFVPSTTIADQNTAVATAQVDELERTDDPIAKPRRLPPLLR